MKRLNIVCGAYGSGKTEFAIALALHMQSESSGKVGLIDLDIVNPYFRSRDIGNELEKFNLTVISSGAGYEEADIPALSPRIFSLLQDNSYQVVFDVGGDPVGARALGRFNQYFVKEPYEFLVVINPFRPDTKNISETLKIISGLQNTSRLKATGIVSNINLGLETTRELWESGLKLIDQILEQTGLPLVYHMVSESLYRNNLAFFDQYPVFPVKLRMLPPWLQDIN